MRSERQQLLVYQKALWLRKPFHHLRHSVSLASTGPSLAYAQLVLSFDVSNSRLDTASGGPRYPFLPHLLPISTH